MTSIESMQAFESFLMVGARFSRLTVDERKISGTEGEHEIAVSIEGRDPTISSHRYADRPVIEQVVSASAVVKGDDDGADGAHLFFIECTAGFVGTEEKFDGDLKLFKAAEAQFARALYWLVRERIQSVFSVTMLRAHRQLPWDLLEKQVPAPSHDKPTVKKVAAKKAAAKKSPPKSVG